MSALVIGAAQVEGFLAPLDASLAALRSSFLPPLTSHAGAVWMPVALALVLIAAVSAFMWTRDGMRQVGTSALLVFAGVEAAAMILQALGVLMPVSGVYLAIGVAVTLVAAREIAEGRVLLAGLDERRANDLLARVIEDNFDGIVVVGDDGHIIAASRWAGARLGLGDGNLIGVPAADVLPVQMQEAVDRACRGGPTDTGGNTHLLEMSSCTSGDSARMLEFVVTTSSVAGHGGDRRVCCLTFRDVSARHVNEERLSFLATHDPLTGALSRTRLTEVVHESLADEAARERGLTMFVVDLSRFRTVNDTLGHSFGDEVLQKAFARLQAFDFANIARLGGDSFGLIRHGIMDPAYLDGYCGQVLARLSEPYEFGEHRAIMGANMGVTDTAVSGVDPEVLLSHADMALSLAKNAPGNAFMKFRLEMDHRLRHSRDMEAGLRHALERSELSVQFQPQIALATRDLVGVEALVRWTHPQLGQVQPMHFITEAERTGLIIELGRFILDRACREIAGLPIDLRLSVNISPMQFLHGDIVGDVQRTLKETGFPARSLELEITEGLFISNADMINRQLLALRDLGVRIALDDFGTGYSSLSYLGSIPVDTIKIDQSFVRMLPMDTHASAIVSAVLSLSKTLGKTVVAEGIETDDQAWLLQLGGCDIGQGYHFGYPKTVGEILDLVGSDRLEWGSARQAH
ncbi:MAG TPA: EAL domain-containing protein [Devosiaceae bacterium]